MLTPRPLKVKLPSEAFRMPGPNSASHPPRPGPSPIPCEKLHGSLPVGDQRQCDTAIVGAFATRVIGAKVTVWLGSTETVDGRAFPPANPIRNSFTSAE